jgi:hypothetical protein
VDGAGPALPAARTGRRSAAGPEPDAALVRPMTTQRSAAAARSRAASAQPRILAVRARPKRTRRTTPAVRGRRACERQRASPLVPVPDLSGRCAAGHEPPRRNAGAAAAPSCAARLWLYSGLGEPPCCCAAAAEGCLQPLSVSARLPSYGQRKQLDTAWCSRHPLWLESRSIAAGAVVISARSHSQL